MGIEYMMLNDVKSDGFPLILFVYDYTTSYYWQHHVHALCFVDS